MRDIASIFERYEGIRPRLPRAQYPLLTETIESLLDLTHDADAFIFDAFGVLNVGNTPIPGAAERLSQLRAARKHIRILSNAASYSHDEAVTKFQRLGMPVAPDEIVTSRDAALQALTPGVWGCIAAEIDDLGDIPVETRRLGDDLQAYRDVDGILFLSTDGWTEARQALLEKALHERPRPVIIANADLVAPREQGFTIEPGYWGHVLWDKGLCEPAFFGKPYAAVYDLLEATLPVMQARRIVMCGDTLHTDILGAAARGWRTVLVTRDGLFKGHRTQPFCDEAGILPDWCTPRI